MDESHTGNFDFTGGRESFANATDDCWSARHHDLYAKLCPRETKTTKAIQINRKGCQTANKGLHRKCL